GDVAPLGAARPDAPPWLVAAIERALSRDAARRQRDAAELVRALRGPRRVPWLQALAGVALVGVGVLVGALISRRPASTASPSAGATDRPVPAPPRAAPRRPPPAPPRPERPVDPIALWTFDGCADGDLEVPDGSGRGHAGRAALPLNVVRGH